MNINKKRVAVIGTIAAVAISGTGVAYAYWTSTGTGAGSASTGDSVAWVVTGTGTTGLALSPGGPTQTASFTVANAGSGVQRLSQVVVSIAEANGDPWTAAPGCSAADFSLNGGTAGSAATLNIASNLPAGGSSAQSVTIQMVSTSSNQDGCKNVTVPLRYVAS